MDEAIVVDTQACPYAAGKSASFSRVTQQTEDAAADDRDSISYDARLKWTASLGS